MPLRTNNISGALMPLKSATSAIRRRRWGTPQNCASSTRHAMDHPSPMMHPLFVHLLPGGRGITASLWATVASAWSTARKSSHLLELKAPGTFSQTAYLGYTPSVLSLISRIIRTVSINRTLRSPSSPLRLPATLKSWHGEPKVITSTGSIVEPSILVMSPKCCTSYSLITICSAGSKFIHRTSHFLLPTWL